MRGTGILGRQVIPPPKMRRRGIFGGLLPATMVGGARRRRRFFCHGLSNRYKFGQLSVWLAFGNPVQFRACHFANRACLDRLRQADHTALDQVRAELGGLGVQIWVEWMDWMAVFLLGTSSKRVGVQLMKCGFGRNNAPVQNWVEWVAVFLLGTSSKRVGVQWMKCGSKDP